jgi:hypothetical protein
MDLAVPALRCVVVALLACIGHWYSDLLYLAPVGVMVGLVGVDKAKHRLRARRPSRRRRDALPGARR